ncbi:RrF2 family transcriptional regulator [Paenibacillus hodogayensis]|uniref:RrF2 family transcriptional regulator n=1 Tax=Paenibacillus hodogayensis TaxID=279208 RepID=A0ABV5VWN4_9BACL
MGSTNSRGSAVGPPRFGVAVHALVWLTRSGGMLSSANMACQVNSHATFIRRVLQSLVQAGIVEAREGRDGGYTLKKSASCVTLADIYVAVKTECTAESAEADGNVGCGEEAGDLLDVELSKIMSGAEQQTIDYLRRFTLADVMEKVDSFVPIVGSPSQVSNDPSVRS